MASSDWTDEDLDALAEALPDEPEERVTEVLGDLCNGANGDPGEVFHILATAVAFGVYHMHTLFGENFTKALVDSTLEQLPSENATETPHEVH